MAKTSAPFVPTDFPVPDVLETASFRLRMLSSSDALKDYEAVMESGERLRSWSQNGWPHEGFTLQENLADLQRHEREFKAREAFAYTVVALDESRVLGCLYIDPDEAADAVVTMWVRDNEMDLDLPLAHAVTNWIQFEWPFQQVRYEERP